MECFNLWLKGLSGSGKTTIANQLSDYLTSLSLNNEVLDGDIYRAVLSANAGYSEKERNAFRKKIIFLTKILNKHGISCIIALLSSSRSIRDEARDELDNFIEVYVKCPIEVCIKRDPKGLYQKRKEGLEKLVVGIDIVYEEPLHPEIIVETDKLSLETTTSVIMNKLVKLGHLNNNNITTK